MMQRHIGTQGFETSAIGLGCMGFSQGYGPADDTDSIETITASIAAGVDMLDTAMSYGRGHNEELIGKVLTELGSDRAHVKLATKAGIVRGDQGVYLDGKPDHIQTYCDASLRRLGVETIDLYYLHRVDPEVPIAETVGAMADLVRAGKVRYLGLSEVTPIELEAAHAVHPISAVQFEWSLMWREPERTIIPAARRLGAGLVPYSPLGRGFLSATLATDGAIHASQFRKSDPRFNGDALKRNQVQIDALVQLAETLGTTPAQLALAWLLAQGEDVVPIPGTRRRDRALENARAADIILSAAELESIDKVAPPTAWAGDRQSFAVPTTKRPIMEGATR